MVETVIKGGMWHAIHCYAKSNNYMKDHDPITELLYLKCWDFNNLYGCAMSQKLPVDGFEWAGLQSIKNSYKIMT